MEAYYCFIFIFLPLITCAEKLDNRLMSLPSVQCGDGAIIFQFETENPFNGRIYVRGLDNEIRCSKRYPIINIDQNIADQTKFNMSIKRGDCEMDRQRTPDGVAYSIVIVLAFHQVFETQNDLAFRGVCFFRAAKKIAGSLHGITGSMFVVGEKNGKPPAQPFSVNCTYTIRNGSVTGPSLHYVRLGDPVHHIWQCVFTDRRLLHPSTSPSKPKHMAMLVHSCSVKNDQGREYELLDENGCRIDSEVGMASLNYTVQTDTNISSTILRAVSIIRAYKFAGTTRMRFQCAVAICDQGRSECQELMPPKCDDSKPETSGVKRESITELDLSNNLHVLDDFDEQLGEERVSLNFLQQFNQDDNEEASNKARCIAAKCSSGKLN